MKLKQVALILISILLAPSIYGNSITGKVVRVIDGDTLVLLDKKHKQLKIRLAEIDTPEKKQPWGKKAKKALSKLVANKRVKIRVVTKDRYKRIVGTVIRLPDNLNVNSEMVKTGNAWVYRKYAKTQQLYKLERIAKSKKLGLWKLPKAERTPPWEWRKRKRNGKKI